MRLAVVPEEADSTYILRSRFDAIFVKVDEPLGRLQKRAEGDTVSSLPEGGPSWQGPCLVHVFGGNDHWVFFFRLARRTHGTEATRVVNLGRGAFD